MLVHFESGAPENLGEYVLAKHDRVRLRNAPEVKRLYSYDDSGILPGAGQSRSPIG
jgi:hypothetical protein